MSVWYCIPSKRPPDQANEVLKLWRERGYRIALWLDARQPIPQNHDAHIFGEYYSGYSQAVNLLISVLFDEWDDECEWIVTGGDDIEPDPNHSAEEIAEQCARHFSPEVLPHWKKHTMPGTTFGVMQPTGDQWGDKDGPYIQRVCGSPWIGREFARRINQGRGPLWPEYFHMGSDEELQAVATKYGVLWQRSDLTHFHRHWGRPRQGEKMGMADRMPDFLKRANSPEEWRKYKKLFAERQAAGFPGSDPIA